MKRLFLILCLFFSTAHAETLTASVKKTATVEEARLQAFNNLPRRIDMAGFPKFDPDHMANIIAITQKQTCLEDRAITVTESGYTVSFYGETTSANYSNSGKLESIDITDKPTPKNLQDLTRFPLRAAGYIKGSLSRVGYMPQFGETYVFTSKGKFIGRWKGNYAFNANGAIIGTRHLHGACNP